MFGDKGPGPDEGGGISGGGGGESTPAPAGPRVSEELIWKARAEEAEKKLADVTERVKTLERELGEARSAAEAADQRRQIDLCAGSCGAIDPETVSVLAERAIAGMDEPDVRGAIEGLRRTKPFLFVRRAGAGRAGARASAMSASVEALGGEGLEELAEDARASGDRRVLLRYLRERRGA